MTATTTSTKATNRQPTVVLFTTPTCSWCRKIKQHLKKHKVRFKEIDVSKDERAAKDMVRRTGQQGVPVTLIQNRPIVGFDRKLINRLLDINDH